MSQSFLSTLHHDIPHSGVVSSVKSLALRITKLLIAHKRAVAFVVTGAAVTYNIAAVIHRPNVDMSFSQAASCVEKFTLFPGLHKIGSDSQFTVGFQGGLSLFGAKIGSNKVCAQPAEAVKPQAIHSVGYSLFGISAVGQRMMIASSEYPKLKTEILAEKTVAANRLLKLELAQADAVFGYKFMTNNHSQECKKEKSSVLCDITQANLKQGEQYALQVMRTFKGRDVESLYDDTIKTAEPLSITTSSIADKQTMYEPVSSVVFSASYDLVAQPTVSAFVGDQKLDYEIEVNGANMVITFTENIPWRSVVDIKIEELEATSGATLDEPYTLQFTTSGGPKVTGSNVASYRVEPTHTFAVTFDQSVGETQSFKETISLKGAEGNVGLNVYASGSQILIHPNTALRHCSSYTLAINNKVKNAYDIAGDSSWSYTFKTRCSVVSKIGTSVQGRGIHAYSFGTGSSVVVFVGGMHGTEASGTNTLDDFIDALERSPERIPAYRRVVVIPNSSPDSIAHGTRTNANGVDLNRNFPADDWQSEVHMPGNVVSPTGGGSAALSEPESQALASYISALSPRLVLTYHAVASVVIGNDAGDANTLAGIYAQKSGYTHQYDASADETFGYPTTGEFEDWLHDKKGIPALLVELGTSRSSSFSKNQDAMWHMVTLP